MLLHLPVTDHEERSCRLIPEDKKNRIELKGTIGKSQQDPREPIPAVQQGVPGASEVDIIESMDEVVGTHPRDWRTHGGTSTISESRHELEDIVWRSYGMLRYSRRISYIEAMDHLSNVRLGIILAMIKNT